MKVNRPHIKLTYNGKNITEDVSRSLVSFAYSDHLDEADTLDIQLEDAELKWQNSWYPEKGAKVTAELGIDGGVIINCGTFEVDEIELAGPPDSVTMRCIAAGFKEGQKRTRKSHVHEGKTLAEIVKTVADAAGLKVQGKISDIRVGRIVQQKERDLRFLRRLATEYGYTFNVRDDTVIFIQTLDLENTKAVASFRKEDLLSYSIKDKSFGIFKKASIKYHNPATSETVEHVETESGSNSADDTLALKYTAETEAQARMMTKVALHEANKLQQSGSFSFPGSPLLCSGNVIEVQGLGYISGDYIIETAAHSVSIDGGWIVDADVYKVNYKTDA